MALTITCLMLATTPGFRRSRLEIAPRRVKSDLDNFFRSWDPLGGHLDAIFVDVDSDVASNIDLDLNLEPSWEPPEGQYH